MARRVGVLALCAALCAVEGKQKWKEKNKKYKAGAKEKKADGVRAEAPTARPTRPKAEPTSDLWDADTLWFLAEGDRCWGVPRDGLGRSDPWHEGLSWDEHPYGCVEEAAVGRFDICRKFATSRLAENEFINAFMFCDHCVAEGWGQNCWLWHLPDDEVRGATWCDAKTEMYAPDPERINEADLGFVVGRLNVENGFDYKVRIKKELVVPCAAHIIFPEVWPRFDDELLAEMGFETQPPPPPGGGEGGDDDDPNGAEL